MGNLALEFASKYFNAQLDNTCDICGASPMTANCNNAGCDV